MGNSSGNPTGDPTVEIDPEDQAPYNFLEDIDKRLERIKVAIIGANTKGRDPEILLDMYDLLSEAVENIEALLSDE